MGGGDDEDDSEESGGEVDEVSVAGTSEENPAADGKRDQWTKHERGVDVPRGQARSKLQAINSKAYAALVGSDKQPGPALALEIFPQEQSFEGADRFSVREEVKELLLSLRGVVPDLLITSEGLDDRTVHSLTVRFESKHLARSARMRILEEHSGGVWPPFAVAFASPTEI